jgi:hypothetical protein
LVQSPESFENKPDSHVKAGNYIPASSGCKSSSEADDAKRTAVRKKGVPIFVRKLESAQTYKGKKKKDPSGSNAGVLHMSENTEKLLELKCKELKIHHRTPTDMTKKPSANVDIKKKILVGATQSGMHKKMSSAVKLKIKNHMAKGFQKGKSGQSKKPVSENPVSKLKRKEDVKNAVDAVDVEMPDLTSCLAAVATEFAAVDENIRKTTHLRRSSHDSSPGPHQSSKSPSSSQQPPLLRKEARDVPPPLSPNASSKLI